MKYDTIQDLHRVEEAIYAVVQEIIDDNDLTIGVAIRSSEPDDVWGCHKSEVAEEGVEWFDAKPLIRQGDDGNDEPDVDAINEVACQFVFVR